MAQAERDTDAPAPVRDPYFLVYHYKVRVGVFIVFKAIWAMGTAEGDRTPPPSGGLEGPLDSALPLPLGARPAADGSLPQAVCARLGPMSRVPRRREGGAAPPGHRLPRCRLRVRQAG